MDQILFHIGDVAVSLAWAAGAAAVIMGAIFLSVLATLMHASDARREEARAREAAAQELEERLGELARIQAEMAGGMRMMGEQLAGRQAELGRTLGERLDNVTHRIGQSMESTTRHTTDSLRKLHERLAVIDNAQKNLTDLTTQVTVLRDVLANKQSRGAFGQARMEAIIQDGMPKSCYEFQFTLSNNTRPDCVVFLPDSRPLAIDAKFPLEGMTAFKDATGEHERRVAATRLRNDVSRHIADIASKYLLPGETQDMALMFVPSESVYAELHDGFDDLFQKAYRARVVLVSPSLLMLAVQVIQQIQKDAKMREAADCIRKEVTHLLDDVGRLRERVVKLERHFGQANDDVRQILISADKIEKRGTRIEEMEFDAEEGAPAVPLSHPLPLLQAGE